MSYIGVVSTLKQSLVQNLLKKFFKKGVFTMSIFKGMKDDTILWFIILFVLLFFSGDNRMCGRNDRCDSCCD